MINLSSTTFQSFLNFTETFSSSGSKVTKSYFLFNKIPYKSQTELIFISNIILFSPCISFPSIKKYLIYKLSKVFYHKYFSKTNKLV